MRPENIFDATIPHTSTKCHEFTKDTFYFSVWYIYTQSLQAAIRCTWTNWTCFHYIGACFVTMRCVCREKLGWRRRWFFFSRLILFYLQYEKNVIQRNVHGSPATALQLEICARRLNTKSRIVQEGCTLLCIFDGFIYLHTVVYPSCCLRDKNRRNMFLAHIRLLWDLRCVCRENSYGDKHGFCFFDGIFFQVRVRYRRRRCQKNTSTALQVQMCDGSQKNTFIDEGFILVSVWYLLTVNKINVLSERGCLLWDGAVYGATKNR